jgi:hypothetical protein
MNKGILVFICEKNRSKRNLFPEKKIKKNLFYRLKGFEKAGLFTKEVSVNIFKKAIKSDLS